MSSEKQVAASRANGKRSRGPATEAGRRKSKMNARKHGLRAEEGSAVPCRTWVMPTRSRRAQVAGIQYDAQTDYDEFMISSSVSLAIDVECSRRVRAADVESETEDLNANDADRADELGTFFFRTPTGPPPCLGSTRFPWIRSGLPGAERQLTRTSPRGLSKGLRRPWQGANSSCGNGSAYARWPRPVSGYHPIGSEPFECSAGSLWRRWNTGAWP